MNKCIAVIWAIFTIIVLSGTAVKAESESIEQRSFEKARSDTYSQLLLAHHAGNRPDDAPDIEDRVHGGDYDPDWDPNGDSPPEPGGRDDDRNTENS